MNDPTFVLVTGKNSEGRATAPNNAARVYFVCNPSISKLILGKQLPLKQSAAETVIWLIPTAATAAPLEALNGKPKQCSLHIAPRSSPT